MNYIEEANQTKSDQFHGELVPLSYFQTLVSGIINRIEELDRVKKALFYGKDDVNFHVRDNDGCQSMPTLISDNHAQGVDLIHGIIGKVTEAGELLEALMRCIDDPIANVDTVNLVEEVGDGMWYDAIILRALGTSMEDAQAINIAKLRARFPNKFTEYDAQNRDLTGEREILEQGKHTPEQFAKASNPVAIIGAEAAKAVEHDDKRALPLPKINDEVLALLTACNSLLNSFALQGVAVPRNLLNDLTIFCRQNLGYAVQFDHLGRARFREFELMGGVPAMLDGAASMTELYGKHLQAMLAGENQHKIDALEVMRVLGLIELATAAIRNAFGWTRITVEAKARQDLDAERGLVDQSSTKH